MAINRMEWELLKQLDQKGGSPLGDLLRDNYKQVFEVLQQVDDLIQNRGIRVDDPSRSYGRIIKQAQGVVEEAEDIEESGVKFIKSNYNELNDIFVSVSDRGLKKFQS